MGNFHLARIFFFARCLCRNFFFFPDKYCFLLNSEILIHCFMFLCFINYSTLHDNRSKHTGHFNAKSLRKCTHSGRGGSHLEWTASLCIFSVPSLWNSFPTAHHNDAILHSPKQPFCSALHEMSIQKRRYLFSKSEILK